MTHNLAPPRRSIWRAQLEVVVGALAFALSVPLGRRLLSSVQPLALSGVLYFAAGVSLLGLWKLRSSGEADRASRLRGRDWRWLGLAILAGSILGPLALFFGLRRIAGHVAGLLLNFEAVFTIAIGALLYAERLGRRGWLGVVAVLAGAVILSWPAGGGEGLRGQLVGAISVIVACACWAVDNNAIQKVSGRDTRQVVGIKGLVGGTVSLAMAALVGQLGGWTWASAAAAAALGIVSYGVSIVLFVRGLRSLGVIQTSALFSLAPGFAAVLSYAILHERVNLPGVVSLLGMSAGALLLATDRHEHQHRHEALEHAHVHSHDEHHQHEHGGQELAAIPHSHRHRHEPMEHTHVHVHDVHHRHKHGLSGKPERSKAEEPK